MMQEKFNLPRHRKYHPIPSRRKLPRKLFRGAGYVERTIENYYTRESISERPTALSALREIHFCAFSFKLPWTLQRIFSSHLNSHLFPPPIHFGSFAWRLRQGDRGRALNHTHRENTRQSSFFSSSSTTTTSIRHCPKTARRYKQLEAMKRMPLVLYTLVYLYSFAVQKERRAKL